MKGPVAVFCALAFARLSGAEGGAAPPSGREASLRAICSRLGIGEGGKVADVGAGNGSDSFIFASILGPGGTVFSEEIDEGKVKAVLQGARDKKLSQIVPVLGQSDDPRLPDGSLDLIYMHFVFHHFSAPAAMLRNLWLDLKPGGYMVVVEMGRGPPREWIPFEEREKKHVLTGEPAVVRQAREAGFLFLDVLDDLWHEKNAFVLAFQRPGDRREPAGDPDLPLEIEGRKLIGALPFEGTGSLNVAVVALDRGRAVLPALKEALGSRVTIFDIVLEEWMVRKDELPPLPQGLAVEILRTERGAISPPPGLAFDAVLFIDGYHLLWDPVSVLAGIHKRLSPRGFLLVAERRGPEGESRRLSGHRRRYFPGLVRSELMDAGFGEPLELDPPSGDRFALLFRPRPGERWVRGLPAVDGPGALLAASREETFAGCGRQGKERR